MITSPEDAARYLLRHSPDLHFEKPLLGGHPAWHYRGFDGPAAFWEASRTLLAEERFCPAEAFLVSGETRRLVREHAETLITQFDRRSL